MAFKQLDLRARFYAVRTVVFFPPKVLKYGKEISRDFYFFLTVLKNKYGEEISRDFYVLSFLLSTCDLKHTIPKILEFSDFARVFSLSSSLFFGVRKDVGSKEGYLVFCSILLCIFF